MALGVCSFEFECDLTDAGTRTRKLSDGRSSYDPYSVFFFGVRETWILLVRFLGNLGDGHPPLIPKFFSWVFLNPYGIGLMSLSPYYIPNPPKQPGRFQSPIKTSRGPIWVLGICIYTSTFQWVSSLNPKGWLIDTLYKPLLLNWVDDDHPPLYSRWWFQICFLFSSRSLGK